ncbi:Peptidoglycan D,D-transpeptidase FtsI [Rubrobacter xylanophilus DSM 9941]|uniref:peptidoglycan D,D-transpeptidase FtsI family protein n=1 Tax=Rubrobacter xylanophilus TaxID=49319 RepID=UPI001C6435FF|nr:penicillin-binding protein 2 [Rubrobacter xylanophilus]QYJ14733.1 Peptidoglycan D,D-transpeptidase FtsI [Rubrobacter xylanophilus DSM 9941]
MKTTAQRRISGRRGDRSARVMPRESRAGRARASGPVGHGRLRIALLALVGVMLLLGGRAAYMTLGGIEHLDGLERRSALDGELRQRGSILGADGRELAVSVGAVRVVATPYQVENPGQAAARLAGVLEPHTGQSAAELERLLSRRGPDGELSGYSVLATVRPDVAEEVLGLDIPGVYLEPATRRVYPEGDLASQLLGHVGRYGEAFGGVEARYDEALSRGEDVRLTLDAAVQQRLQETLAKTVAEYDAKTALGVVLRADDGAIVALANHPTYDNNRFADAPAWMQRNRVLTDPYEPGSTFKPFTIAAALEEGVVEPESTFLVPDAIPVADRIIHDSLPHETRPMDLSEILAESSNVGAVQVAMRLGGRALERYIERFGFGEPTGVDLWGEDPGRVPEYREWSGSSIGNIPIGQGLTVTPLQLAAGYAMLANGGHEVRPHVTGDEGPGPRLISRETSDIVRGMLREVVESGTGRLARIPGYTVAGKTGTSQKVEPETGTYGDEYVASFVGFAPASDPEYVMLIVVDEPQGSIWGERVAAPAFREVMAFTLSYFNVPPDRGRAKEVTP